MSELPQAHPIPDPLFTPKLNASLAKAQGAMANAKKDVANPFFNTKYADLAGIIDACRKPLADNDLAIVQLVANDEKGVTVTTRLLHASGESISSSCWVPVVKKDPQGYGSAMTYARRFGLQALVGVAAEVDDDGNAHNTEKKPSPAQEWKSKKEKPAETAHWSDVGAPLSERAKLEVRFAEAKDMEAVKLVAADVTEKAKTGKLSAEDREFLRPVFARRISELGPK